MKDVWFGIKVTFGAYIGWNLAKGLDMFWEQRFPTTRKWEKK